MQLVEYFKDLPDRDWYCAVEKPTLWKRWVKHPAGIYCRRPFSPWVLEHEVGSRLWLGEKVIWDADKCPFSRWDFDAAVNSSCKCGHVISGVRLEKQARCPACCVWDKLMAKPAQT